MMKTSSLALLSILCCLPAVANVNFECVTDLASGFHYDSELYEWENVNFLAGERFVITEHGKDSYRVNRLGQDTKWSATCTPRTDQTEDSFSCMGGADQFHFNRKEMRFTAFRYFGYWNGSTDSLSISIGRCFPE